MGPIREASEAVASVPRADGSIIPMLLKDLSPLPPLKELRAQEGVVSPAAVAARGSG